MKQTTSKSLVITLLLSLVVIAVCCISSPEQKQAQQKKVDSETSAKSKSKYAPIYLTTYTTYKDPSRSDGMGMKEELSTLTAEYFETKLNRMHDGIHHQADRYLEPLVDLETLHSVSVGITDKDRKPLQFKSAADFLKFMSERGYEAVDAENERTHIWFKFKKRQ